MKQTQYEAILAYLKRRGSATIGDLNAAACRCYGYERDELLAFYEGKIAKWWMPDDVIFVDSIPLGATGKMQKSVLRDAYQDHLVNATP